MTTPTSNPPDLRVSLDALSTERIDDAYARLDVLGTADQVDLMMLQGVQAATAVARQADAIARAVDAIAARREAGGRIVYIGAGTAGRMGVLDASEIPPTFGTDSSEVVGVIAGGEDALRHAVENAEDDPVAGAASVDDVDVRKNDVVIGLSASGRTPYVIGALERARALGALTVSIACNTDAVISRYADLIIEIDVGPELVAGSTRLKAGTAQKLVVNTLSTLVMVKSGKVYGNLMVDVRATNEKLRARAQNIVMHATGCSATTAATALEEAGGSAKLAILIAAGAPPSAARAALEETKGRLRPALAAIRAA